jgi:beta-glucosidase/6-phospho-beta-glucosidase/beta-galactosidase
MKNSFIWPRDTYRVFKKLNRVAPNGIFATGIENSDPMVGTRRRNQLKEAHNFYENWEERLEQINALGIKWLRFGEGYSLTHLGKDKYNFDLTAKVVKKCEELGINVMIDLLHFGLPDWMHKENPKNPYFQNSDFPYHFAEYVKVFTGFFPSVKYFTPVNEPMVTAMCSAYIGAWNEQRKDEKSYAKAVTNIARAAILAKETIEQVWKEENRAAEPIFFQNASFEKAIAGAGLSDMEKVDKFNNFLRVAPLDLILGHRDENVKKHFKLNGVSENDYEWFMKHGNIKNLVLGIDHYPWCVHEYTDNSVTNKEPKDRYQLASLVKEYWLRYPLPLMHMEVNAVNEHAKDICEKTYEEMLLLGKKGYPVLGMSWFGDDLQIGWQSNLSGPTADSEYRVGLFYKGEKEPIADLFMDYATKGIKYKKYKYLRGALLFMFYTRYAENMQKKIKQISQVAVTDSLKKVMPDFRVPVKGRRLAKIFTRTKEI